MSTPAHKFSPLTTDMDQTPNVESAVPGYLLLRPTDDGWMLVGTDGEVIFHGPGIEGRRQCLRFAHDHRAILLRS
jgi:hypothetical protein